MPPLIQDLNQVILETADISPAPQILPKLKRLLIDPESDLNDVVDLIKMDVGLTGQVLKQANSVYFGRGAKVDSLETAVQRFGANKVHKMVLIASAKSSLNRKLSHYNYSETGLFEASICCAELMGELASEHQFMERDAAYTIGLFHAVGKIIVDSYFSKKGIIFYESDRHSVTLEFERKLLGFNHAEAGATLLKSWNFSEGIFEPLKTQFILIPGDVPHCLTSLNLSFAAFAAKTLADFSFEPETVIDSYAESYPELWSALGGDQAIAKTALERARVELFDNLLTTVRN